MANGRGAKNMALQMATGVYKGIRGIGKGIKSVVSSYEQGFKDVDTAKKEQGEKMIDDNFGNQKNYKKLQ